MTPEEQRLILDYLDGTLDAAAALRLNQLLLENADARAQLRTAATVDIHLRELAAATAQRPLPASVLQSTRGISWRDRFLPRAFKLPTIAGVALGVVCSSAVWAYVRTDLSDALEPLAQVLSDSFESTTAPGNLGVPDQFNTWDGDDARIAAVTASITPRTGARMLQLLSSDFRGENAESSHVGDQMQLIDLAPHRMEIETGRVLVRAEASFNQIAPAAGQEFAGGVQLFAFGYDPRDHRGKRWKAWLYNDHLGFSGQQQQRTDSDPATWERVVATLPLPPGTRFLIVHIRVNRLKPDPEAAPVAFSGSFVDDVKAELLLRTPAAAGKEFAAQ